MSSKLHCPNCKSENIQITTESSVNGGITTHHGAISSTHMSNTHRNYWMCADCGTKFRNIQSLEEEIKKCKNTPIIYGILAILCIVLTIYIAIQSSKAILGMFIVPYAFGSAIGALIFAILFFVSKNKNKKMQEELTYLQEKCFN